MGIDLIWEDEDGNSLGEIIDEKNLFALALKNDKVHDSICLRFIDLYGDTTFNQIQLKVLINEMEAFLHLIKDQPAIQQIGMVLDFIKNCKETHTYIKFVGD